MTGMYQCRDIVHQGQLFWGPGVPENSYRDTSFRDIPSPHGSLLKVSSSAVSVSLCFLKKVDIGVPESKKYATHMYNNKYFCHDLNTS